MHDKVAYIIKHIPAIQWLYRHVVSLFLRLIGLVIKTDKRMVLLSSYSGDQYSDSPKVIFEAMQKDPRFTGYRYVWAFGTPEVFTVPGAEKVKIDTLSYFITALKAGVWITNVNIERGLHFKKRETIYLNTWHGTGPKKGGNAVKGRKDYDFSYVDIVCVDGQYAKNEMVNWFNAREENLLYCGRPREDALLAMGQQDIMRIRKVLEIPENKKVLLYMPTWREYGNLQLNASLWERSLSDEYVVLVRAHHLTRGNLLEADRRFWIDVSTYPEVNDLYWVADILISDYSSAFFDYGLLGKPMICFAYDYEKYESDNGLFMDLKNEFPGGLQRTEEEVIRFIKNMDYQTEKKRCKAYVDGYVSHQGNATEACLERLQAIIRSGNRKGE